ncbi:MAG: hypothetical protein WAU65_01140 [Candidatus Nanoarchaeia archaeon]
MQNKRGSTLLMETIIAVIINVVFIAILIFFLISKSGTSAVLEEKYAKEIALILDSSKPGMMISLNMADAIKASKSSLGESSLKNIVSIQGNVVTVTLRQNGGYSYSFFNDVNTSRNYLDEANNQWIFFIGDYNAQKGS